MKAVRQLLALLAWLIIEIPTTLFVVFVMVKVFLQQRRARKMGRESVISMEGKERPA